MGTFSALNLIGVIYPKENLIGASIGYGDILALNQLQRLAVIWGTGSADVGDADIGSLPAGPSASGPHMQWLKVSHPNCSGSQSDG